MSRSNIRHDVPQDALARLVESLRVLPGVGPKSAQRMAYYLLQHDRNGAAVLAESLGMLSKRSGIANVVIPSQSTSFAQPVQTHGAILPYSVSWKLQQIR